MNAATGPFAIAAALLALGGAAKALRPGETANALAAAGVPVGPSLVRVGGALEAAVGLGALVTGSRGFAALVAVSYLSFTAFVLLALARRTPIASCGCFGKADTPPSRVHVAVNLAAAGAALAIVVQPVPGFLDVLADQPLAGVPYVLLVVTGVAAALTALTVLPRVTAGIGTRADG